MKVKQELHLVLIFLLIVSIPTYNGQSTISWLHGIVSSISGNKKAIVDTLFGLYDSVTTESHTGFFRIEGHLVKLVNEAGVLADGTSCDPIGLCDPIVSAYVDYENSAADFGAPASADYQFYTLLFSVREENSPVIDKLITRDICGQTFKKIAVRVHVIDRDRVGSNDLIGNFRCFVDIKRRVLENAELTEWSAIQSCEGVDQKEKIKLLWQYRMYKIDPRECGVLPSNSFGFATMKPANAIF